MDVCAQHPGPGKPTKEACFPLTFCPHSADHRGRRYWGRLENSNPLIMNHSLIFRELLLGF